jgi:hypothetical protein
MELVQDNVQWKTSIGKPLVSTARELVKQLGLVYTFHFV